MAATVFHPPPPATQDMTDASATVKLEDDIHAILKTEFKDDPATVRVITSQVTTVIYQYPPPRDPDLLTVTFRLDVLRQLMAVFRAVALAGARKQQLVTLLWSPISVYYCQFLPDVADQWNRWIDQHLDQGVDLIKELVHINPEHFTQVATSFAAARCLEFCCLCLCGNSCAPKPRREYK